MLDESKGVALHFAMGLGKTLTTISLVNLLGVKRGLVIAPKSVCAVWPREFRIHSERDYKVVSIIRRPGKKTDLSTAKRAEYAQELLDSGEDVIIVCNYESMWRKPLAQTLLDAKFDLIVMDESQRIKNAQSKMSKFAHKLGPTAKHRLNLTGTPIAGNGADIFSQYKFLNPLVFGKSWSTFTKRFFHTDYWGNVTHEINAEFLREQIDSISFTAEQDLIDMPEKLHITLPCELSGEAKKAYDKIIEGLWVEISAEDNEGMIARIALTQGLRAQQASSGIFAGVRPKDNPRATPKVERIKGSPKVEILTDLLDAINFNEDKCVIFCNFKEEISDCLEVAESLGLKAGEISGRSKTGLNSDAKMAEEYDLVVSQISAGATGIDLTAANHTIYFSLTYSINDFEQSMARTHRPGQNKTTRFYTILCDGIEEKIYEALMNKRSASDWFKEEARRRRKALGK